MAGGKNTITQRIALDGGKEIEAELKALGAVGEEAFRRLQKAAKDFKGPDTSFSGKLTAAFTSIGEAGAKLRTSMEGVGQSWQKVSDATATFRNRLGVASLAITGVVAGFGLVAKAAANSGDAIGDAAQKTGLAVKQYQTLQASAELAGVGADSFNSAMARLNKALAEGKGLRDTEGKFVAVKDAAARIKEGFGVAEIAVSRFGQKLKESDDAIGKPIETLNNLGIKTKDLNGQLRPTEEILKDLSDRFSKMPDGAVKTAAAIAIFGKSGSDLIPFLNAGRAGIEAFEDRLKSLGLVLDETQVKSLADLADEADLLGFSFGRLRDQIVAAIGPQLTASAGGLMEVIARNRDAIISFTSYVATEAIGIIKDFFAALTGGEVERPWVQEWTDNIIAFGRTVQSVFTTVLVPAFNLFMAAADKVAQGINAIFNTNLTGGEVALIAVLGTISGAFVALAAVIGGTITAVSSLAGVGAAVATGIVAVAAGIATLVTTYWDEIASYADSAAVSIAAGWEKLTGAISGIWDSILSYLSSGWAALEAGPRNFAAFISNALTGAVNTIKTAWTEATSFIQSSVNSVISSIQSVIASIRSAISAAASLVGIGGGDSGSVQGFATGGPVRGAGSGTSDSILARLSNGEFVIRTKAVQHYGPQLLDAINRMRLPLKNLRGFAQGGGINIPSFKQGLPAFASGGLVSLEQMFSGMMPQMALPSMGSVAAPVINMGRPVNLTIGGQTFAGLMAPEDVADRLARFAQGQALRSAGRKPGWAG